MKYVSVCAGIEAATVAWHPLGWEPVLFSEIEPFPCAVLKHHYPDVPLVGDFTQLLDNPPEADLLVGGTPCQAFSVAGKRLSLEDYHGNLSLAFADLFHAGQYRWCVWENVPGVLSTKDNAFGCLLGRLVGADAPLHPARGNKWTNAGVVSGPLAVAAWRVLDAQYFGVAQRRRRVFVCVSRGAGNWAAAEALLPVGESVSRHPPPRPEARQDAPTDAPTGARSGGAVGVAFQQNSRSEVRLVGEDGSVVGAIASEPGAQQQNYVVAPTLPARNKSGGGMGTDFDCDGGLVLGEPVDVPDIVGALSDGAHNGGGLNGQDAYSGRIIPVAMRQREGKTLGEQGTLATSGLSLTLAANANDQVLFDPVAFNNRQDPVVSGDISQPRGAKDNGMGVVQTFSTPAIGDIRKDEVASTMSANTGGGGETQNPAFVLEVSHTISAKWAKQSGGTAGGTEINNLVVPPVASLTTEQTPKSAIDLAQTLTKGSPTGGGHPQAVAGMALRPRRLTPTECERLQGFPDGYTNIRWKKGTAPDGPRYKALGNSMAVPCMYWIGKRIHGVES